MVLLCAGAAQADTIDPVIIVRGGTGSVHLTSPNFSLVFPTSTGPSQGCVASLTTANQYAGVPAGEIILTCVFLNASPAPFTNLVITFATQGPLTVNCLGVCSSFSGSNNNTASFFFDPAIAIFTPGIPQLFPSPEVVVTFVAFNPGTTLTGAFNTPEPATLALFGTGLLAIATRLRKKRV
jgi:hypothetical protein